MSALNPLLVLAPFAVAAVTLVFVLWRLTGRLARLEVNDAAQDQRLALLERPEVIRRAMEQHVNAQAVLRRTTVAAMNGYAGHEREGQ